MSSSSASFKTLKPSGRLLVQLASLAALAALVAGPQPVGALGQGCPFEDGSCQEYCGQQGCQLGYCGHFAWIQCICRKCGDEWNWYDKVRYNPDKTVNQTELDSLKLNGTAPLILTNSNGGQQQQQQVSVVEAKPAAAASGSKAANDGKTLAPSTTTSAPTTSTTTTTTSTSTSTTSTTKRPAATLTTLLIPDLSDGSKVDLNDVPDENSEKFLDYLARNHEKLVQAQHSASVSASARRQQQQPQQQVGSSSSTNEDEDQSAPGDETSTGATGDLAAEPTDQGEAPTGGAVPIDLSERDDNVETVEIQISSSNNQQQQQQQPDKQTKSDNQQQQQTTTTTTTSSQMTRLLRMAVAGEDEASELDFE